MKKSIFGRFSADAIKLSVFSLVILPFFLGFASAKEITTLYVSATESQGLSSNKPSETYDSLQEALEVAYKAASAAGGGTYRIQVESGLYIAQSVNLKAPPPNSVFEIVGLPGAEKRPIFDGRNRGETWFTLRAKSQNRSRFLFEGIEVRNYLTAMSFNGAREEPETHLGANTIRNMIFRNIGQRAASNPKPSTAAIRFVNSRGNVIENSKFLVVKNRRCDAGLHAIYLAHHSSDNKIIGNFFDKSCGSPIRIRDASNNNIAENNVFKDIQFTAVFDEWYCDKSKNKLCTKKGPECPSWNNRYLPNNVVRNSNPNAMAQPTFVHVPQVSASCDYPAARSAVSAGQRISIP